MWICACVSNGYDGNVALDVVCFHKENDAVKHACERAILDMDKNECNDIRIPQFALYGDIVAAYRSADYSSALSLYERWSEEFSEAVGYKYTVKVWQDIVRG